MKFIPNGSEQPEITMSVKGTASWEAFMLRALRVADTHRVVAQLGRDTTTAKRNLLAGDSVFYKDGSRPA